VVTWYVFPGAEHAQAFVRHRVMRACPVVDDPETVTDIADNADGAEAEVEAIWLRAVSLYRSGVHPAVQLCIRHRGEIVLDRAVGHARGALPGRTIDERAVPLTTTTPINLFSAGKAVAAMAMHLLHEQGKFNLDAPVARYLPHFARHGKATITTRQLLTHRAGIPELPPEAFDLDVLADPEQIERMLCDLRPVSAPGRVTAYHALSGGMVMDALARRISGRSLRDVVATEIKAPIGLRRFDLGVAPDEVAEVATNVVAGPPVLPPLAQHIARLIGIGWDQAVLLSNDPRFLTAVVPSGNVVVTARDAAAFYQCLLDGGSWEGRKVFARETVREAVKADRATTLDRRIGLPLQYGSGFMLGTRTISLYGWNHPRAFGHVGLANTFTWADPDRELVVALVTTGKAVLGPHIPALYNLVREIHRTFPATR
jgi:CubicO group peptidase (beta-lactamase class C family)